MWRRLRLGPGLGLLFVLSVAGCRTAPQPPAGTRAPALPSSTAAWPPLTPAVVSEPLQIAPPAPLQEPAAPAGAVQVTNVVEAWVSLESWSRANGCGQPTPLPGQPGPRFELRAPHGVLTLAIGSRQAVYDGCLWWLGHAPTLVNGLPRVHALDALKNLAPLLGPSSRPWLSGRTVVIDPGHGGKDSGARSVFNGACEKEYTLDWAWRLAWWLAARGWTVYLTRTNDATVTLAERVALAELVRADFFLSLHLNSGLPNRDLAGIETYCLTPAGLPSSLVRGYDDDPRLVFPNNAFDSENFQAAFDLHRALVRATGAADRGVRRARFMAVLRWQNRPAVLLEGGYLTNPAEARRLAAPVYRQTLAEAVGRWLESQPSVPAVSSQ